MMAMIVLGCLLAVSLTVAGAVAFREAPRDMRDTACFVFVLCAAVIVALVFAVEGF